MKIVCDACAAKYSIADEKVAGKVFKIRCKKCSNVIVVRGTADAEGGAPEQLEQKETRVFDYSGYDNPSDAVAAADAGVVDGAVWHIVIDQEQVGPLSPEEVRAHFARGEIDNESFIWREGFADWERVDSLSEFADLSAAAGANGNVDDAAAAMFGGPALDDGAAADPADLFTAQSAQPMVAASGDIGGLFGGGAAASPSASPSDDGGLFGGAASEPMMAEASAEEKLKGQRNENSVLFSLNNLASLASDSKPAAASAPRAAAASGGGGGGGMAQAGGQEGSGLIDIRAMASMYVGNTGGGAAPSAGIDDLPVFSQPAITSASPVLMPVATPANNNKLLVALVAGIGALVLIAVLLVVLVLRGSDKGDSGKQAANSAAPDGDDSGDSDKPAGDGDSDKPGDGDGDGDVPGVVPTGDGDGDKAAATKAGDEAKAAKAEAARLKREEEKRIRAEQLASETPRQRKARLKKEKAARDKKEAARKKREEARRLAKLEKANSKPPKKPEKPEKPSSGGCDELDCLVNPNKACCRKGKKPKKPSGGDSSLPARPPTSSLGKAMGRAAGGARACGKKAGFNGKVSVKVRVSGSGRVSSAKASGGKGSVNSCVASAVKSRAKFPKSKNGISFTYKYRL